MHQISKWIELDAGHRVPNHASKCKHLHGHRYRVTLTVEGELVSADSNRSDAGMVTDFGVLKQALVEVVHDPHDHRLLLWEHDPLAESKDLQTFIPAAIFLPCIPTAEELARYWGQALIRWLEQFDEPFWVHSVEVRETPTSTAVWRP